MNFMDYFIIGWLILGAVINVALVDKPRERITPGVAALGVIITAILIACFIAAHYWA